MYIQTCKEGLYVRASRQADTGSSVPDAQPDEIIEASDTSNYKSWHRPIPFLLTYITQTRTLSVSHTNKHIPEDTH